MLSPKAAELCLRVFSATPTVSSFSHLNVTERVNKHVCLYPNTLNQTSNHSKLAFSYLSRTNIDNLASSFIIETAVFILPFIKSNKLLFCFLSLRFFWSTGELSGCAGRILIIDWGGGGVKGCRERIYILYLYTRGLRKHRQALWPIMQFSKWVFSAT